MIDEEALAARLHAQDRLIATLFLAVVQAPVVTKDSLIAAVQENADRAAAAGHHQVATILRHRVKDLRAADFAQATGAGPFPGPAL